MPVHRPGSCQHLSAPTGADPALGSTAGLETAPVGSRVVVPLTPRDQPPRAWLTVRPVPPCKQQKRSSASLIP